MPSGLVGSISLPIATNKQFNSIEILVVEHSCSLNELATLISYTPRLVRMRINEIITNDSNTKTIV